MVLFVKKDQSKAFEFVNMMKQVTPVMGINVQDPQMIEIRDDRTETYLRNIRENLHPRVQMVVVIFPTSRDDRYAAVKKLCCVESPVPSQVLPSKLTTVFCLSVNTFVLLCCIVFVHFWLGKMPMFKVPINPSENVYFCKS